MTTEIQSQTAQFEAWQKEQAKTDADRAKEEAVTKKLQKSQTVEHTVLKTNGESLHLCADNKWRTDAELNSLGVEG